MYLTLNHLTKKFPARGKQGEVVAVDDVSLSIAKGQFITLLGPSGCGKTTTLRLIAGFEFPTAGQIILDGQHLEEVPPNRRDMAMVFQSYAIFPHLNVFENIAYGLKIKKLATAEIKRKVAEVMKLTQLTGLEERAPNQLSGGQQQRVALARALVVEPKVLLFDEPLSNLDAKLREEMRFEIRDLQKRLGITAIYVTHAQEEALVMSDFLPARVEACEARSARVRAAGATFTVPALSGLTRDQSLWLHIRPYDIRFVDESVQDNVLPGIVKQATYLGNIMDYRVEVAPDTALRVQASTERRYAVGDRVRLHFPVARCHLITEE